MKMLSLAYIPLMISSLFSQYEILVALPTVSIASLGNAGLFGFEESDEQYKEQI